MHTTESPPHPRALPAIEVTVPLVGVQLGRRSWLLIIASSVVGLLTIVWPLLVPALATGAGQQGAHAPFVFAMLLPVVLLLVVAQLSDGGLDAKSLALLGVLTAINAALRPVLGAGTAGVESIFFMLILAGRAFGPGFGYLLGFTSMFASALLTAGIGPWLPAQMLCAAWVGLGAGLLPRGLRGRMELWVMIGYGIVSAYLFGALMNLWFWPFIAGMPESFPGSASSVAFIPDASFLENLMNFVRFTLVSSTAGWDTGRAITNSVALLLLGRPVLAVLRRSAGMGRLVPATGVS